jgi:uncharacterized protein YukE
MTLKVEPVALERYAGQVACAADDASAARTYLDAYRIAGSWNGVLIVPVLGALIRSLDATTGATGRITCVLEGSEGGLTAAARHYRHTDLRNAVRLDAALPGRCATVPTALEEQWAGNPCAPAFADSREPAEHLKPVDDAEYSHPFSVLDNISVSHWALKAFDAVFGFNPLERVTEFFLGDWQAVARAGAAIGRAADAMHDLGYNLQGGAIALRGYWEGHAADAAYARFTGLASGVESTVDPMRQISGQFAATAHGVWNACEAVTGYVKGLLDSAIIAGIAAAAGTVTAETGVGAVLGYGVAAYEVSRMLHAWAAATRVMSALYGAVQGSLGFIESQLSRLQAAQLPDLSSQAPYRYPFAVAS